MTTLKAIVVDDEKLARRGMVLRLAEMPEIEVIEQCSNAEAAVKAIASLSPDLVFLDIQMPGMDGFDMVCELQADAMPLIIFVTAFDQYAIEAFKVHAVAMCLSALMTTDCSKRWSVLLKVTRWSLVATQKSN